MLVTAFANDRVERVVVRGSPANETSVDLVGRWCAAGIPTVLAGVGDVADGDLVLGRLDVLHGLSGIEPGLLELLWLERRGVRVLNGAAVMARAHDKLLTARALARAGLPHPWTLHVLPGREWPLLTAPLVVKPRCGSWGDDCFRCDTQAELDECRAIVATRAWFRHQGALVQRLVRPPGHDLRVLVAAGRVVGAERRIAAAGEWRTNVSLGGTTEPVDPSPVACRLALAAAAAIDGDLVGVDLLPDGAGWTILELNGAVEFDEGYSLGGGDVFLDAAEALGLRAAEAEPVTAAV